MNYSKISRQFVCKMAMLLAFMFAACSENNGSIAGGTVEETGVYATLENITISGIARRTLERPSEDVRQIVMEGFEKGTLITLYELDSISFLKSGVVLTDSIANDSGDFTFSNVTLTNPYVLITALRPAPEDSYAYSVFVDVRDTGKFHIDMLTHLEALRALHLAQAGMGFSQAKNQAKTEVLNAFGIYWLSDNVRNEDPIEYAALIHSLSGVLPTFESIIFDGTHVDMLFDAIAEHGSFQHMDASFDSGFVDIVNANIGHLQFLFAYPYEYYEKKGEESIRFYRIEQSMAKYYAGMLSFVLGVGRCDQTRDGEIFNAPKPDYTQSCIADYSLLCRSENWRLVMPRMEHAEDSMMDVRDGRHYKTVTIDVDGAKQTWMAENLRFDAQEGSSCDDEWSFAEGCFYSNEALKSNVCPDGWRLPKLVDWEKLMSSVRNYYAVPNSVAASYLFDFNDLGNPVGFGLTARASYGISLAMDSDESLEDASAYNNVHFSIVSGYGYSVSSEWLPVRCIKN